MAFIHCPHCSREVSDLAHKCPGCGTSLDVYKENVIFCKYCGMEILPDEIHGETAFCVSCRRSQKIEITPLANLRTPSKEKKHIIIPFDEILVEEEPESKSIKRNEQIVSSSYNQGTPINPVSNVYVQGEQTNGLGIAGFVISLVTLFLFWVPVLGIILGLVGFILSSAGMSKHPRGLAIAGFVISLILLILMILFTVAIGSFLSYLRQH